MVVTIVGRTDSRITGLGRYIYGLHDSLTAAGHDIRLAPPLHPPLPAAVYNQLRQRGIDLSTFLRNYPVRVDLGEADVCHLTSQNLATLLLARPMPPTVITIQDLYLMIERMQQRQGLRGVEYWADRAAVAGIMKAHELIATSAFTRQTVIDLLHYPAERISVINIPVNAERLRPMPVPADFRARYGLPPEAPLIVYVGSEDPRKNLDTLITAFSLIAPHIGDAVLVKAGRVHFRAEAERLRQRVADLGLSNRVAFITELPDDDLPVLYNAADVVVMPSLFEGFGLPALEAMACGRPVIAANATSLPEVVGDTGVLFDPLRADDLAVALVRLLEDPNQRQTLGAAARARALEFSYARQARQTWDVYCRVYSQAQQQLPTATIERENSA